MCSAVYEKVLYHLTSIFYVDRRICAPWEILFHLSWCARELRKVAEEVNPINKTTAANFRRHFSKQKYHCSAQKVAIYVCSSAHSECNIRKIYHFLCSYAASLAWRDLLLDVPLMESKNRWDFVWINSTPHDCCATFYITFLACVVCQNCTLQDFLSWMKNGPHTVKNRAFDSKKSQQSEKVIRKLL